MGYIGDLLNSRKYKIDPPNGVSIPRDVQPVALLNKAFLLPGLEPVVFVTMQRWIIMNATNPTDRRVASCLSQLTNGDPVSYGFITMIDKITGIVSYPVVEVTLGSNLPNKNSKTGVLTGHLFANGLLLVTRQKVAVDAGESNSLILANTEANAKFHLAGVKYHCQDVGCPLKHNQKPYVYTFQRCPACGNVFHETEDKVL